METIWVLIVSFAIGDNVSIRGPFTSEAQCAESRDRLALWAFRLPKVLQHVSTCRRLTETSYTMGDLET